MELRLWLELGLGLALRLSLGVGLVRVLRSRVPNSNTSAISMHSFDHVTYKSRRTSITHRSGHGHCAVKVRLGLGSDIVINDITDDDIFSKYATTFCVS